MTELKNDWNNFTNFTNSPAYTRQNGIPNFLNVFSALHMVSPLSVGTFSSIAAARNEQINLSADLAFCNSRNIDYQPVLYPGFA